jgi:hypothetical protein
MKLFVWEDVLNSYWEGMAVAIARSKEEAIIVLAKNLTPSRIDELRRTTPQEIPFSPRPQPQGWYVYGGD